MKSHWNYSTNTASHFDSPTTGTASNTTGFLQAGFRNSLFLISTLAVLLTFSQGCGRFVEKEIKPLFKKDSPVIMSSGNQRDVMDELQNNREKIQELKKEQALLLDANLRLFTQLEFIKTDSAKARTAKIATAKTHIAKTTTAKPHVQMPIPPEWKTFSEFDFNKMGVEAFSDGNYDLALVHFSNSANVNSGFYEAFTNMGVVYMALGQYKDAITHFKKALAIAPSFKAAKNYLKQAEDSLQKGKVEEKKEAVD